MHTRLSFFLARLLLTTLAGCVLMIRSSAQAGDPLNAEAETWRQAHRFVDLHQHLGDGPEYLARAIRIMDDAGIGLGVNLTGGTVTREGDAPSFFEKNKALGDTRYPGRFLYYMNLDYTHWDDPDFSEQAVHQVEEAHRLGAAGLKEFKRLGLNLRDKTGKLIPIDDPKLDPVWKRCGELNMPISIHISDPKAFWLPFNESNERWKELKDHKSWWFGDPNVYPSREELHAARNRVIARHPETTFVCVHFANNPEDIDAVDAWLDRYPNMMADLAARVPELGRHDPQKVHDLFIKHQDRILFATDFMVYDRLTLGSGGSGPAPTDRDGVDFYQKHWRWLETWDKDFEHMTPIQGDWTISGIGLPSTVLRKIYFDNARRLLARSLPSPTLNARRLDRDFEPDADLQKAAWTTAQPVWMDLQSKDGAPLAQAATTVRALWSSRFLYLAYECPFTELTQFEPVRTDKERLGLWDRDVVEAFIGSDAEHINRYTEFEVAPSNEKLDLTLNLPERDFAWSSGFLTATRVNDAAKRWDCEMRIPLSALAPTAPKPGTEWRLNLYRCDRAMNAFLAWRPTLQGSFHAPERFGRLTFVE